MATQPPAATASLRALGLRGNDREVEAVNRGRVESTTPSMEQSEESEESEAEDDSAAISVDQVSVFVHGRLRRQRNHCGRGLANHPKTEPYKIFVNPQKVLNPIKDWEAKFIYTYSGFAKAANETDKPMYVASVIKFERVDGVRVVWVGKRASRRSHEPARLEFPTRRSYTNWICGRTYISGPQGEADWKIAVEDRIEKILKGEAFTDDPLNRKRNWLEQPFPISLFALIVMPPGPSTRVQPPRVYTTI